MNKILRGLTLGAIAALLCTSLHAQVFNKFGPANGVLKGSTTTYQTNSAASTDIVSLWSGTCDATHFLAGNGACLVPSGTGVTSVGLTVPSWYSVTGSPVTGSGTLAISAATGQTANSFLATPNGSTGAVGLRAIVGADLPPINLGSTANGGVLSSSILLGTNGGTSNGFFSITGPATSLKTFTFPNASATVLTSNAAVTVAQGGTGLATLPAHGVLLGEGTSNVGNVAAMAADTLLQGQGASADPAAVSVNNCGSSTQALSYSTSTHTFGCQTIAGSGTPGGADTNVQYNSSGAFAGSSLFTWNNTNSQLFINSAATNTNPFTWCANGRTSGERCWTWRQGSSGDVAFDAADDAGVPNGTHAAIDFGRTAGAITSITVGNSTDLPPTTINASKTTLVTNSTGEAIRLQGSTSGVTSKAYMSFGDSAGTRTGYVGATGTTGGPVIVESDNSDIRFIPVSSTGTVSVSNDGGSTFVELTRGPRRLIWASMSATGAGCTVLNSNYVTGCSRTGAGAYSISGTSLTNNMGCTVSVTATPSNGGRIGVISGSSSGISVGVYNVSGTAVDDGFQFTCLSPT